MNRTGLVIALVVGVCVGVVFAIYPQLDIAISRAFFNEFVSRLSGAIQPRGAAFARCLQLCDRIARGTGLYRDRAQARSAAPTDADVRTRGAVSDRDARARTGPDGECDPEGQLEPAAARRDSGIPRAGKICPVVGSSRQLRQKLFIRRRRGRRRILDAGAGCARASGMATARLRRRRYCSARRREA